MSNLKHLTREQLLQERRETIQYIGRLRGKMNNQETRLIWINRYIEEKGYSMETLPEVGSEVVYIGQDRAAVPYAMSNWRDGDSLEVLSHKEVDSTKIAICWNLRDLTVSGVVAEHLKPKLHPQVEALANLKTPTMGVFGEDLAIKLFEAGCRVPQDLTPEVLQELWEKYMKSGDTKIPDLAKTFGWAVSEYVRGNA